MAIKIETHGDVVRRTGKVMATAAAASAVMSFTMVALAFGRDFAAPITVGQMQFFGLTAGVFIALSLSGAMSYRSGCLMLELAQTRRELAQISQTDQLTGLLNRRGFDAAAATALDQAQADGASAAVLMCDIDHFKSINDRYGHEIGDKVLVAIADVLRQFALRRGALVARYGGEEFAVVLTGLSHEQAADGAEEIRRDCAARTILDDVTQLPVTISIGFTIKTSGFDLGDLMRTADQALYTAKRHGRDRVEHARDAA
ncbi:GGDEF domain-containing protein [Bradyrhizobium sp. ISRA443]|uniref:GGDEF domain-containing protein n=1 Tax=unclassified Bradyrhizobium TaxID=2631580 RepID=UPI00247ABF4F|nr:MULTISPECIES: GGDEF domain-containing protein [unclassified Bradyrhizobium]WGR94685.1 GGDEF domain-containing protein [Bradyrhizobium sp. ISRA435]WGR99496.1 GGDEF domain-containing protein [Bradyrhizobium sp. ISRA436]WGS06386.1 GGDEF domain-containing protein [Bradyrhizobium sp. ISRA437]WGS13270.1 GGDEF domain-containing protein [Bradyrhizobium sp. ISRA443]